MTKLNNSKDEKDVWTQTVGTTFERGLLLFVCVCVRERGGDHGNRKEERNKNRERNHFFLVSVGKRRKKMKTVVEKKIKRVVECIETDKEKVIYAQASTCTYSYIE